MSGISTAHVAASSLMAGVLTSSDRTAIIERGRHYSYSTLASLTTHIAECLDACGVGHIVGISVPNSLELLAAFLALRRLGRSIVLLPLKMSPDAVALVHDELKPREYIWADEERAHLSYLSLGTATTIDGANRRLHCASSGALEIRRRHMADGDSFVYKVTSGSTGRQKIVVLGSPEIEAEATQVARTLSLGRADRVLAGVSMLHSYGFDLGLLAPLAAGATLVVHDGFSPAALEDISALGITVFLGIPRMYEVFLSRYRDNSPSLGGVRYLLSCTAPLAISTIERFYNRFGLPICQHYGTSETGALANHVTSEILERPGSVGRPVDGVVLQIVDALGRETTKTAGFVFARSRAIARGYLSDVQARVDPGRRVGFMDEGFKTGDIGLIDEDGYLYLQGRTDIGSHKARLIALTKESEQ
jgi:long-chain acyl-CoA synthetase